MIRPLETDGLPAPSDFELEEMDRRSRRRRRPKLSFNGYTYYRAMVDRPINDQREAWHEWLMCLAGLRCSVRVWDALWDQFIEGQDAPDLVDTQQDALV